MLKIDNRPILEHTINALPEEINEIIIVIGYLGNKIKNYFGKKYKNRRIKYVVQKDLNGSGEALWCAKKYLKGKFLILAADDLYYKNDLRKLIKYNLAILAHRAKNASRFGVLKVDKNRNLRSFEEKPQGVKNKLVNTGVYMMDKRIFNYDLIKVREEFLLPQTIFEMSKDFPIKIVKAEKWFPIGYPEDLKRADKIIGKFRN